MSQLTNDSVQMFLATKNLNEKQRINKENCINMEIE